VTYVYLVESKAVLYPLLFQQSPIGYGRVRVFADWCVWEFIVPLCWLVHTSQSQDEDRR